MKGAVLFIMLMGVAFSSERLDLDISFKKRKGLSEIREFREMVKELLKEEFREVAPGIKVKKECRTERGVKGYNRQDKRQGTLR